MNMILLFENDFIGEKEILLKGRRFEHIKSIHKSSVGDSLKVGLLNGAIGTGEIVHLDSESVKMAIELNENPPKPLECVLILAMPRPLMFKRILMHICTLGIKEIHLIHSKRVEKSFWASPVLEIENINNELYLGLEQACDTILPKVFIHHKFKTFVENQGHELANGRRAFIAHPSLCKEINKSSDDKSVLAIGPEGGFIDYEVEKFLEAGFVPLSLGKRILRVETAVPVAVSNIMNF